MNCRVRAALCAWVVLLLSPLPAAAAQPGETTTINVATKPFEPFSFQKDGEWVGFSIDLWDAVAKELELSYRWHESHSVGALLDAVASRKAEVGIAGVTITFDRESRVDFSFPFYNSGLQILVPWESVDESSDVWNAVLPALLRISLVVFVVIIFCAHLIWLAERRRNSEMFPRSYLKGIREATWWATVTMTTVGYGDRVPKSNAGRSVAFIWMFTGIIIISYFTATVTTALTMQRLEGAVNGPTDLPGRLCGTVEESTASYWLERSKARSKTYPTIEAAYADLEAGLLEAVVYDAPVLQNYAVQDGKGKVRVVGEVFMRQSYGIVLAPDSPLREGINKAILKLRETGVYAELHRKWFGTEE